MKKATLIFLITILLTVLVTTTAAASKHMIVNGYVPYAYETEDTFEYGICDPVLQGHAVQPLNPPGKAVHGFFVAMDIEGCVYERIYSGTCEFTIIPVEDFMDPDTKPGRATVKHCTGELEGLHGVLTIGQYYFYEARYHFDSRK